MWSLVFIVIFGVNINMTHVDNFISKRLCEKAGQELIKNTQHVDAQYSCVLEID